MSKILKPRRGSASTMSGPKANTVLAAGEIFFETPNGGVGSGHGPGIKMGDGITAYSSLPYYMEPTNLATETIEVVANTKTTSTAALNDVSSGNTIGSLVGSLKQAISLTKSELTSSIDDLTQWKDSLGTSENDVVPFKFAVDSSGNYGYKKAGADTVTPFKTDIVHTGVYTATARGDLDMGVNHSYRWVRTTGVPNNNTGTYAVPYHSTALDMGANNTYRYVNTTNAYNQGYNDGKYVVPGTSTVREEHLSSGAETNTADQTYIAPSKGLIVAGFMYSNSTGSYGQLEYNGQVRAYIGSPNLIAMYMDAWVVNAGDVIRAYAHGVKNDTSNSSACVLIRFVAY